MPDQTSYIEAYETIPVYEENGAVVIDFAPGIKATFGKYTAVALCEAVRKVADGIE